MNLTLSEIAAATHAQLSDDTLSALTVTTIEFDSRLIHAMPITPRFDDDSLTTLENPNESGSLFLPLKGTRDGHDFIEQAFANGAIATFAEHAVSQPHLLVADTLIAFQDLARYILEKEKPTVIAVTGSNGKTTTKDMIAAVLSKKYKTYKTQGNYNNAIGLPYTVCHMPEGTEKLVLEMGMDHAGDIDKLSQLARPTLGVITLIGESHLEFLGSREAIAKGKMGITAGLSPTDELVAPADPIIDPYIPENQVVTRFGADKDIFITTLFEHRDTLTFQTNFLDETLTVPVPGKFNATNAMLAAYVGHKFGVPDQQIKQALAHVSLAKNRTEWLKAANGADILADAYNANPTSMRLILETFQAIRRNPKGRKLAVLADMLELGATSPQLHREMAESLDFTLLDRLYLYGPLMQHLADKLAGNPSVRFFTDLSALTKAVQTDVQPMDQILFKGSNGMHLSEVITALTKK